MNQGKLSQFDDQETQDVSKKDRADVEVGQSKSVISDDKDASQTPDDDFSEKDGVGLKEKASKVQDKNQEDLTIKNEFDAINSMFKPTYVENEDDARTLGDVLKIDEESVSDIESMENFTENRKDNRKPKPPLDKDGNILTDDDVNDGSIGAGKKSGGILRDNWDDISKDRAPNNSSAEYERSSGGLGSQKMSTPPPVAWITGSVYDGTWDLLGMSGRGSYTMPHGAYPDLTIPCTSVILG
uniref:Uncharacterized protein n=1 Tax=Timema bartmani TaxID=61472 RepID=A0A7R9EWK5_9NEOP|nr:unnamed protein product [Timema bartmani]